jgi:hypothetical protein
MEVQRGHIRCYWGEKAHLDRNWMPPDIERVK